MEEGDLAAGKSIAAERGAWIVFEDEAGQSMTPPRARTWGRIGQTPVVRVRGRGSGRVSMAGMTCYKPGERSRLIYAIREYRGRKDEPKGFGWRDFRDLIVRARIQLGGPIVLVWDKCAVWRFVVSPTHSGGIWRNIPGPPGLPGGESRRGQQHVREAVTARRRPRRCAARLARYGQSWIA